MKSIISIIAMSFLISCSSDTKTAELKLDSMQCMMCSMSVEEAVADLEGNRLERQIWKGDLQGIAY